MTPPVILLALGVLLGLSAFFSLSETAIMALSRIRLRHLVAQGRRRAKIIQGLVNHLDHFLATILLANNLVNVAFSSLATVLCLAVLGPRWGVAAATLGATGVLLLFGEITPKIAAAQYPERLALAVAPLVRVLVGGLGPAVTMLTRISRALLRMTGLHLKPRSPLITEEEIRLMIEVGKEEGVLGEQERQLLHRIFEFGDLKVGDVMVPRAEMVAAHAGATHDEVLTVLTEQGHSRIPVYREAPDRIVGILYAQELLHIWREGWLITLQDLLHPPFEVPPDRRVSDLLREFQHQKVPIAIVVDPQGKALGMVTLEDLVEEIVGDLA